MGTAAPSLANELPQKPITVTLDWDQISDLFFNFCEDGAHVDQANSFARMIGLPQEHVPALVRDFESRL